MDQMDSPELKNSIDEYLDSLIRELPSEQDLAVTNVLSARFKRRMQRLVHMAHRMENKWIEQAQIARTEGSPHIRFKKRLVILAIIITIMTSAFSISSSREAIAGFVVQVYEKFSTIIETRKSIEKYLSNKGYKVVESKGIIATYKLEKDILVKQPYMQIWALQNVEPSDYYNKNIITYHYIVKNHKLDSYGDKGNTKLWLLVCDEKIIGGYSLQNNSEVIVGGVYSVDGLDLIEVTGKDYKVWLESWLKKYK